MANRPEIRISLERLWADAMEQVGMEMAVIAQLIAGSMGQKVPKFRSTLWKTIAVHKKNALEYEIRPSVNYSAYVEDGVKPGGKGLPRFNPNNDIAQWLKSKSPSRFVGPQPLVRKRAPRAGSKAFEAAQSVLRDRYYGLSAHIRRHGVDAQPFVEPTVKEMTPVAIERVNQAVRRALAARGAS